MGFYFLYLEYIIHKLSNPDALIASGMLFLEIVENLRIPEL